MSRNLFLAILSMDAYHRGSNAGLTTNGLGAGSNAGAQIGNATISQVADNPQQHQPIGFYAAAYNWNGETIISFPGL